METSKALNKDIDYLNSIRPTDCNKDFLKSTLFYDMAELIAAGAYTAWELVLCGSPSDHQRSYYDKAKDPKVGDLVLEISSMKFVIAINRIGYLKSIAREPYPKPDYWNDKDDGEWEPTCRDIWTINTLDGRDYRWENCSFIVIPIKELRNGKA